jgi:hypothetical protein
VSDSQIAVLLALFFFFFKLVSYLFKNMFLNLIDVIIIHIYGV